VTVIRAAAIRVMIQKLRLLFSAGIVVARRRRGGRAGGKGADSSRSVRACIALPCCGGCSRPGIPPAWLRRFSFDAALFTAYNGFRWISSAEFCWSVVAAFAVSQISYFSS
jgi:hypothetical protein